MFRTTSMVSPDEIPFNSALGRYDLIKAVVHLQLGTILDLI
jgi:hypothetical protein